MINRRKIIIVKEFIQNKPPIKIKINKKKNLIYIKFQSKKNFKYFVLNI